MPDELRAALVIAPRASAEIRVAAAWYDEQRRGLSIEFLHALDQTFDQIAEHPASFPAVRGPVRRALVMRFPYGVFFAEEADGIVVLSIQHTRRNPQRWPSRPAR